MNITTHFNSNLYKQLKQCVFELIRCFCIVQTKLSYLITHIVNIIVYLYIILSIELSYMFLSSLYHSLHFLHTFKVCQVYLFLCDIKFDIICNLVIVLLVYCMQRGWVAMYQIFSNCVTNTICVIWQTVKKKKSIVIYGEFRKRHRFVRWLAKVCRKYESTVYW